MEGINICSIKGSIAFSITCSIKGLLIVLLKVLLMIKLFFSLL